MKDPNQANQYDPKQRMGFMKDEIIVPDDINWSDDEILRLFGFDEKEIIDEPFGYQTQDKTQ